MYVIQTSWSALTASKINVFSVFNSLSLSHAALQLASMTSLIFIRYSSTLELRKLFNLLSKCLSYLLSTRFDGSEPEVHIHFSKSCMHSPFVTKSFKDTSFRFFPLSVIPGTTSCSSFQCFNNYQDVTSNRKAYYFLIKLEKTLLQILGFIIGI